MYKYNEVYDEIEKSLQDDLDVAHLEVPRNLKNVVTYSKVFRCYYCGKDSYAEDIDKVTIEECCHNRKDRRKYVSILKTHQNSPKWYRCPICHQNSKRHGWKQMI